MRDARDTSELDKALREFDAITEAVQEERALALEDRRFAFIAGAQWEGPWGEQFANAPMVEINKTAAGLEKIINDYRANRVTVNFRPADDVADPETADLLDGMFRADAYRSNAGQAFDNAFEEAAAGGYGAWGLSVVEEDEFDPDNDRKLVSFYPIVDADQSVFWDMSSVNYDKSDAKHCFVLSSMTRASFEEEYPEADCSSWPENLYKCHYDWYQPDVITIAKLYRVEIVREKRRIFTNSVTAETRAFWNSELEDDDAQDLLDQGWEEQDSVIRKRKRISKTVFSGSNVLEKKTYIAGDRIPVVMVYGQRRFIDKMERAQGHVRKAKDPQRVYNTQITGLVETAAESPRDRPIFDPEQVAGFEQHWAEAAINRAPYAYARALRDADGNPVSLGPIGMVTAPQVQPAMAALIQITANDITTLTNADDGADQVQANISAEAMDIAATRTDAKSAMYMDNMKLSMKWCGEVYKGMARDTYIEEGRRVETLDEEEHDGEAILLEEVVDEDGRFRVRNDLSNGRYKVISDVTEATTTRRDKTVKSCFSGAQIVAPFNPGLANALVGTALMNMDGEGLEGVQKYVRNMGIQEGWVEPNEEEQQQLAEQAQNQQPDATHTALLAQAKDLEASADLKGKQGVKALADAELSQARKIQTLADAGAKAADADATTLQMMQPPQQNQQSPDQAPAPASAA